MKTARTDFHFSRLPGHPLRHAHQLTASAVKVKLAPFDRPTHRPLVHGLGQELTGTGLAFPDALGGGEAQPTGTKSPKEICPMASAGKMGSGPRTPGLRLGIADLPRQWG